MIEDIKRLWEDGYSMTQIALFLNTNRNIIAGKMYRARIQGIRFDSRAAATVRKVATIVPRVELDNPITRLRMADCRYILNDDTSNPVYCCEPIDRRSYCKKHADICYTKKEKRK
jgi:hypothetical protein